MRKTHLILIVLCVAWQATLTAQTKSQRRIYLWDVTRSMNGKMCKNGKEIDDLNGVNIWTDVQKFIERDINSLTDESTEIVVLPFKTNVLDVKTEKATKEGKGRLIDFIKKYDNAGCSGTNIVASIKYVQANIMKNDKRNLLFLLTDGKQSGGNADLIPLIRNWEEYAKLNDAYAVYVMLTKGAEDKEIIDEIGQTKGIDVVTKPGTDFLDLQPSELVKFNIKDDQNKQAKVSIVCKKNIALPENIKVKISIEDNQYISVNQTTIIKDGKIAFDVKYEQPYDTLKYILPIEENIHLPLHIELVNADEIKSSTGLIVLLNPKDIAIELINKPEKILKISIKK